MSLASSSRITLLGANGADALPNPSPLEAELRFFLVFLAESETKLLLLYGEEASSWPCCDVEAGVTNAHADNGNRDRKRMLDEDFMVRSCVRGMRL